MAGFEAADAYVVHVAQAGDGREARALLAALPAEVAAVVVGAGDELRAPARAARGWIAGDAPPERLRAALAAVLQGLSVHEAGRDAAGAAAAPPGGDVEPLTARELEVFELLGKGLSNREIAGLLGISAHTAKYHVAQILAKVGAATRAEAVGLGLRLGLIGL
jgi:DNA-binding NarL/FixJ family response regulator